MPIDLTHTYSFVAIFWSGYMFRALPREKEPLGAFFMGLIAGALFPLTMWMYYEYRKGKKNTPDNAHQEAPPS